MPSENPQVKGPLKGILKLLMSLLLKFGPDFLDKPGTVRSSAPATLESVSAAIDAIPAGTTFSLAGFEPGMVGGPVTDALVAQALQSLVDFAKAQAEAHLDDVADLVKRLTDRVSFLP